MSKIKTLPLPNFYDPKQASDPTYAPDINNLMKLAEEHRKAHGIKNVGGDKKKVTLLSIDFNRDFVFPDGALAVLGRSGTGAVDAQRLGAEFKYRYLHLISEVISTLDTHVPYQIFFSSAHVRKDDGTAIPPYTFVRAEDYRKTYRPNPAMATQLGVDVVWLERQFNYYCQCLDDKAAQSADADDKSLGLYIWPFHCMLGSRGHQLAGVSDAARLFHAFVRGARNYPEVKGTNPLTEHYSIFQPLISKLFDGRPIPLVQKNTALIKRLVESDVVIMEGLASSHCFKASVDDFLTEIMLTMDPKLVKKIYLLRDCTAAVVVPGLDCTDVADRAFARFDAAGMHVVDSTTPIEDWPEINL